SGRKFTFAARWKSGDNIGTQIMLRIIRRNLIGLLLSLPAMSSVGSWALAAEVDLLLVLSSDVSRSIDHQKFLLQRDGYAAAISNRQVLDAIKSGPIGKIAICFVEWSGFGAQKLVIDWTAIDGEASARKFADLIVEAPRSFADRTAIGGGIDFSVAQLARGPFEAPRKNIDVSGDGTNNAGRDVRVPTDQPLPKGLP